ncbi:unnamed protein product [Orchesella dallaii]|uniref:G-protein coupled receptors family 2 profile 2 domain-containing protein n=1 Tax=Orchesella dallaii TaxID=48710 RepID=A0ABP1QEJ2_9HEXA
MESRKSWSFGVILIFIQVFILCRPSTCTTILPRCTNYQDLRQDGSLQQADEVSVAGSLLKVALTPYNLNTTCKKRMDRSVPLRTIGKIGDQLELLPPVWMEMNHSNIMTFGDNGCFYDGSDYFQRTEYCVKTLTDTEIVLNLCEPDCENVGDYGRYCIPKCCSPDEILGFWGSRCRKLQSEEPNWRPVFCKEEHCAKLKGLGIIHFYREQRSCKGTLQRWPVSDVVMGNVTEEMKNIRMHVTDGKLRLKTLSENGKWQTNHQIVSYCVDGFVTSPTASYDGNPQNQVFLVCITHQPDVSSSIASNSTNSTTENSEKYDPWLFASIFIIGSFFLLVIVIVYFMLLSQHTINGLLILSYSISMLLCYVFYVAANFVSMYDEPIAPGIWERSIPCIITAKCTQYFLIVSDLWLTAMNLNLWLTIRSTHVVENSTIRRKVFTNYSVLAWGIPAVLVAAFVITEGYRDTEAKIHFSDCSVAWSRSPIVDIPLKVVFSINVILIFLTFKTIFEAQKVKSSVRCLGSDRFTITFFLKLFCMMGLVRIVQMVLWYFDFDGVQPWYIILVQCVLLFQPIPLFIMFCCNERTRDLLRTNYPKLAGVFDAFALITSTSYAFSICGKKPSNQSESVYTLATFT